MLPIGKTFCYVNMHSCFNVSDGADRKNSLHRDHLCKHNLEEMNSIWYEVYDYSSDTCSLANSSNKSNVKRLIYPG